MKRIVIADLERLVKRMNDITGMPDVPYSEKGVANIGNYHLYYAYGSVGLHRMHSEQGGVATVFGLGSKRSLYERMQAWIDGYNRGSK